MRRIFRFTLAAAVVLVALSLSGGAAVAQENGTDEGPSIEIDTNAESETETATQELDSTLRLMEWEYNDVRDGFELTFEADGSTQITITEAVQFSEGSGQGRIYQTRLPAGPSEIFVPVPRRGGQAAVTMVTPESLDNNRFAYVSTGEQEPDRPPLDYERVQMMVVLTASGAAGLTVGVFVWRREDEQQDYERLI